MADTDDTYDILDFFPENLDQFGESLKQRLEGLKMEWHGQYMQKLSFETSLKAIDSGKWRADKLLASGAKAGSENVRPAYQQQLAQTESNMQQLENSIRVAQKEYDAIRAKQTLRAKEAEAAQAEVQ